MVTNYAGRVGIHSSLIEDRYRKLLCPTTCAVGSPARASGGSTTRPRVQNGSAPESRLARPPKIAFVSDQPQEASPAPRPRFLLIEDVADELATTKAQIYAMVRNGSLAAIKVGGHGQWRIERAKLEEYIAQAYQDTARWVKDNPFGAEAPEREDDAQP